jgi:hypothetical protein
MGFFSSHSYSRYLQVPRLKQTLSLRLQSGRDHCSFAARALPVTNRMPLTVRKFPLDSSSFSAASLLGHWKIGFIR